MVQGAIIDRLTSPSPSLSTSSSQTSSRIAAQLLSINSRSLPLRVILHASVSEADAVILPSSWRTISHAGNRDFVDDKNWRAVMG